MVEISNQSGARQDLISQLLGKRQQGFASQAETKAPVYEPKGREIHDTVDISGSDKIVNQRLHDALVERCISRFHEEERRHDVVKSVLCRELVHSQLDGV